MFHRLSKFYKRWELNKKETSNNLCFYYRYPNMESQDFLREKIYQLIEAYPQFRSIFKETEEEEEEIVTTVTHQALKIDERHVDTNAEACTLIMHLAQQPHDLNQEISLRIAIVTVTETQEFFVFFNIHHILLDGVGLEKFITILNSHFDQQLLIANFVNDIHESVLDANLLAQYQSKMATIAEDYQGYTAKATGIFSSTVILDNILSKQLENFASHEQLSVFNLLLLFYAIFDSKIRNQNSTLLLYPLDMRTHNNVGALGCAVNSVVFPFSWSKGENLLLKIQQHRADFAMWRNIAKLDILDVIAQYSVNTEVASFAASAMAKLPRLMGAEAHMFPQMASSPYGVKYSQVDGEYYFRFDCNDEIFCEEFKQTFLQRFMNFMGKLLTHPEQALDTVDLLLDEQEYCKLLVNFNRTHVDYPRDSTILDLFEKMVAMYPQQIAVSAINGELPYDGKQELSYCELDHRARLFATKLLQHGVKPGDYLAILSARNVNFYVSILSILYVGATFINS